MGRPSYHLSSWVLSYTQVTPDSYHARELGSCCRHLSVTLTEGKKALLPGRKQDCRTLSGMEGRALWAGTCRFTRDILGGGVPCGPYLAQLCRLWTEDDIGIVLHGFRLCMAFWRSCDSPRPPPKGPLPGHKPPIKEAKKRPLLLPRFSGSLWQNGRGPRLLWLPAGRELMREGIHERHGMVLNPTQLRMLGSRPRH